MHKMQIDFCSHKTRIRITNTDGTTKSRIEIRLLFMRIQAFKHSALLLPHHIDMSPQLVWSSCRAVAKLYAKMRIISV